MPQPLQITILGDFDRRKHSHWATEAALFHAAAKLELRIEPRWLSTTACAGVNDLQPLAANHGVWGAPGSPYASSEGMLRALRAVRELDVPYLGTCAGFQYALIEYTRNVLGVADADSAENTPGGANVVITPVACEAPNASTPRLAGAGVARAVPGTRVERLCGPGDLRGEYFCSFETNAAFLPRWQRAGLTLAALGEDGEMRAFELPGNAFFVATLFQPQLSSSFDTPHPLVIGFVRACATRAARV
jgi:CTP synthase (UTP-ammonia lyase)